MAENNFCFSQIYLKDRGFISVENLIKTCGKPLASEPAQCEGLAPPPGQTGGPLLPYNKKLSAPKALFAQISKHFAKILVTVLVKEKRCFYPMQGPFGEGKAVPLSHARLL